VRFGRLTDGAFDVTYAPLRSLWREAQGRDAPPSQEDIRSTLRAVGYDKLVLLQRSAMFAVPGMSVDLGGIAKGYAIDLAAQAMAEAGARSALVDIGGDMRMVGDAGDGRRWTIKVRDPREGDHPPMLLSLADVAVATSGDYARYFVVGDERFSHIIDPRTGWPVRDVPSATVVAPDATTADALATAASVLGAQKALELVRSLPGVECMVMSRGDGDQAPEQVALWFSDGFPALMQ